MIVFRALGKAVVISGVIGVALSCASVGLGAAQDRDHTSIVLQTGSAEEMRGVSSVFVFVARNEALWNQLNEGIKSTSMHSVASYADADVILMLVPEGTGLEPDLGAPSFGAPQQQTAPLTAAILRRRDEKTLAVIYQARFEANEVDVAREALLSRFIELVSVGKGSAPTHR